MGQIEFRPEQPFKVEKPRRALQREPMLRQRKQQLLSWDLQSIFYNGDDNKIDVLCEQSQNILSFIRYIKYFIIKHIEIYYIYREFNERQEKTIFQLYCMKLNLNLSQINLHLDSERPTSHHFVSSRAVLKKGVDPAVVQSCLDSLDVFRDLLEGIPHQKNRVVRDVCKNIDIKNHQEGDLIYDIGEKAKAVYFCLSGLVSISIIEQIKKDQTQSALEQRTQQNSNRNNNQPDKLNTPKTNQNMLTMASISTTANNSSLVNSQQPQIQRVEQQIDRIEAGQGFGQAEFIAQKTREVRATVKQTNTLIARLELDHFTEVLENYKQRVYYKKRDMFQRCSLFSNLPLNKLEFIINNTKPMTINISHQLVREGTDVDTVYLVNKGQISLWKTGIEIDKQKRQKTEQEEQQNDNENGILQKSKSVQLEKSFTINEEEGRNSTNKNYENQEDEMKLKSEKKIKHNRVFSTLLKIKAAKCPLPKQKHNKVFMGLLSEGCFIGDMELAMGCPFKINAICRTQKAEVYYCDRRIILSQMTQQLILQACQQYKLKQEHLRNRINRYISAKEKILQQRQIDLLPPLTKAQIQLKRQLMHRHVQQKPSLIGFSSPRDIQRMIMRKQKRVIRQPQVSKYPVLELFPNHSVKKRLDEPNSPRSFNPLSVVQTQGKKCITEDNEYVDERRRKVSLSPDLPNPQLKRSDELKKFQSMFIQIKPTKINLRDIKYGQQQENMAIVGKILGRYRRGDSKLKSLEDVNESALKKRK